MVERTFVAFDNEAFVVDPSSPSGTPGVGIINNSNTPVGQIFTYLGGVSPQFLTLDDTGGSPDTFNDNQPGGHQIIDGGGLVPDGTPVESESIHFVRQIDANGNEFGPTVAITVFSRDGDFTDVWGMATSVPLVPGARYVKTGGTNNGNSAYTTFVPCFAPGTMIETPSGERPVEEIAEGDRVWTTEGRRVRVRWAGRAEAEGMGDLAPVVFAPGTVGNDRELVVSPQHRMLIAAPRAQLLFGEAVLVPAKHLVGMPGVERRPAPWVVYHHFLFERHRIVRSNGALTESFYPGPTALSAIEAPMRAELFALFPELARDPERFGPMAAPCITRREASVLRQGF